jgi:hypothetical protein
LFKGNLHILRLEMYSSFPRRLLNKIWKATFIRNIPLYHRRIYSQLYLSSQKELFTLACGCNLNSDVCIMKVETFLNISLNYSCDVRKFLFPSFCLCIKHGLCASMVELACSDTFLQRLTLGDVHRISIKHFIFPQKDACT